MTDTGPVYALPDRPTLDPFSAAALAVSDQLAAQTASLDDVAIAFDIKAITEAALGAVEGLPRVPRWIDGEPRSLGGGKRPDQVFPDPAVTVLDPLHPGQVGFELETIDIDGRHTTERFEVPAADVEAWALSVLAAVARSRTLPQ